MPSDTATIESKLATLPELVDTETVTKTETIEADTENGLMDDVADNVPTGSTDSTNLILNAAELPTNLPDSLTNSPAAEHSGQEKVELATEVSAQNLLQNSTKTDSNDEPLKDLTDTGTVHSDLPEPQESLEVLEKVVEEKQDALPQFSDDEIEVSSLQIQIQIQTQTQNQPQTQIQIQIQAQSQTQIQLQKKKTQFSMSTMKTKKRLVVPYTLRTKSLKKNRFFCLKTIQFPKAHHWNMWEKSTEL